jgi:xylulose-5-phosphate/fructose-6-phosphate phosphoketolase
MIVLRSPKGWTGPNVVDGKKVEGFWRSHQVPIDNARQSDAHRDLLEAWLRSYRPEELFDRNGGLLAELRALAPQGDKRMSASPCANAGCEWKPLDRPDWCDYALDVSAPGVMMAESPRAFGEYLADVFRLNAKAFNFRIMSPDETTSNRLGAVFDATNRMWSESIEPFDEHLAPDGRVMEVLSEHLCQGWLEGYVLTGRHGLFNCYEAFIHIVDSMFNQHAKWLKVAREVDWRRPVPSLNYFLSSHVWRQDHNGFSHQDPGFIDHVANKKSDIVRIYFPPDANCLLWVGHHCFGTFDRINVIVCGKQPALQWLSRAEAERHCEAGIGKWEWAGTEVAGSVPDVIMACAGDIPTLETLAAADILRDAIPGLKIRLVNVVDLMKLQSDSLHPHGLPDERFDELFTRDRPVIFAFHSYPQLIHRLTYRRANHDNFHVHGFMEEGTTTTPFDMAVLNRLDRFHLALAVMDRVPALAVQHGPLRSHLLERLEEHRAYIVRHGEDMPDICDWRWSEKSSEDDRRPG